MRVALLTISDSVSSGKRRDASGQALADRCRQLGWEIVRSHIVADDKDAIAAYLRECADSGSVNLVLTTGGTGLGPRDVTPEALAAICERLVPGLGERMREVGCRANPRAALSRSGAGTRGSTVIVNLPGSPLGAVESLDAIAELLPHAIEVMGGARHD
jgi:molybdopterin adenylyltransferase